MLPFREGENIFCIITHKKCRGLVWGTKLQVYQFPPCLLFTVLTCKRYIYWIWPRRMLHVLYRGTVDTVIPLWAASSPSSSSFSDFVTLITFHFFSLALFFFFFFFALFQSPCSPSLSNLSLSSVYISLSPSVSVFTSLPLALSGYWFLFCCYGNWPTVRILLSDLCVRH